ncbi:hypothetical protein TWF730_011253 [Orbilia blumenaviensis]|uniref:C2H2-type domain-containing protein n=1 Tax=Orbilia blumenaviensis TaxID=1796055 RepID=A0AAV9UK31_9PEZI
MTTLMASPTPHPAPATASSHPYTCNTCQVAFKSSDGQRNHMHTDWHRYNLKRRIAELPPITSELFAEKVLTSQAADRAARDRASFEKPCQPCGKVYYSQNAYNNHINSQKHKQRVHALTKSGLINDGTESVMSSTFSMDDTEDGTATPIPTVAQQKEDDAAAKAELSSLVSNLSLTSDKKKAEKGEEEEEEGIPALPITECLFCAHPSPTLQQNLTHMSKLHGLFIPEKPFLVNLEGLIRYLGQKILVGHTCLYCNKPKGGLDGIRTHMRDKGHCMIAFETEAEMLEIGEFYDFRSTYNPDDSDDDEWESDEDDEEGKGEETWEDELGNKTAADKSWETDSDASSCDSAEIGSLKVASVLGEPAGKGRKLSHHRTSSSHHLEDGWHSHAHSHSHTHASHLPHHHHNMQTVYVTETEMHLGNGRSVGHRSLARYYRQNLRDHPSYNDQERDTLAIEDGDAEEAAEGEEGEEPELRLTQAQRRANKAALISRANGGQGLALANKAAKAQAKKMEKKDRAIEQRGRERYQAKIEKQANNQKHYRDPNLQ